MDERPKKVRVPKDCAADALALFEDLCDRDCLGQPVMEKLAWKRAATEQLLSWVTARKAELDNEQLDSNVTAGEPNDPRK